MNDYSIDITLHTTSTLAPEMKIRIAVPSKHQKRYSKAMAIDTFLFDVDGTLIDSNPSHVQAWKSAFSHHGFIVAEDRLATEIGKGGENLIRSVLGDSAELDYGPSLRKMQIDEFVRLANQKPLKVFEGVIPLLTELRHRDFKLAIVTSSGRAVLETIGRSAGIDWASLFDELITAENAAEGKPAPGLLRAAMEKLKVTPAQTVTVGDTPYDAQAARDAGSVSLGFTCGGLNNSERLRAAGMRKTYLHADDLLNTLDDALHIASPATVLLDQVLIDSLMQEALEIARIGLASDEAPIGCVIADGNGRIIAGAHNQMNKTQNKIAHAEIIAFQSAAGKVPTDARDLILVSTLEPCVMCLGAAMEAAVDTVIFGLPAPMDGGRSRVNAPLSPESQMPRIIGHVMAERSKDLLTEFGNRASATPSQRDFVKQLLSAQ